MAEFSWAAAGDVGLGLIKGIGSGLSALGSAEIANANARAANRVREGQNEVRRANAGLAGTVRSLNNQRLAEAAGKQLDVLVQNSVRTQDSFTRGNFEQTIRNAEEYGRSAAGAAAAGLGGGSIEAMSRLTLLTAERKRQVGMDAQADVTYDQMQQMLGIMPSAVQRMDTSPIVGGFDQGRNVSTGNGMGGFAGALLNGLLEKKDSLAVLLGSLAPDMQGKRPTETAISFPVDRPYVRGEALPFEIPPVGPYPDDTPRHAGRAETLRGL